jgi:hypothetical protein
MRPGEYFQEAFASPRYHFALGVLLLIVGLVVLQTTPFQTAGWIVFSLAVPPILDFASWNKVVSFSFGGDYGEFSDPEVEAFRPMGAVWRYAAFSALLIAVQFVREANVFDDENGAAAAFGVLVPFFALVAWMIVAQRADCRRYASETGIPLKH